MTQFFSRRTFAFLRDLKNNNNREWFTDNKARYEQYVVEPALEFIVAMGPRLQKISPFYNAIAKRTGGSLFRIYRDSRFSQDKTPYKTHVGIQFRHQAGKDAHAPCFYVHIEPKECFLGVGMWHPPSEDLYKIRQWLQKNHADWQKIARKKRFQENFFLGGDTLKRPPKGFDANHPAIELLKMKDFIALKKISEAVVTADALDLVCAQDFKIAAPINASVCAALDLRF